MSLANKSFRSSRPAWILASVLSTALLLGCGESEDDASTTTDRDSHSRVEGDPEDDSSGDVIDPVLGTSGSDLGEGRRTESTDQSDDLIEIEEVVDNIEQEFEYEDGTVKTRCSVNIFTLFDADNPLKGHWEFHGPYAEFHPDGAKLCEGAYEEGLRVGDWTFWYNDGKESKRGSYIEGKPDGVWQCFRPDGSLERDESYSLGILDGRWIAYWEDGESPQVQREFKNGERDGTWIRWHDVEGQQASEIHYTAGVLDGVRLQWFDNGQMASEEHFRDGKRHGRSASWNHTGTKISDWRYEDGKRVENLQG